MAQYPGRLESANTKEFGIVSAVEIAGHRTVKTIDELYAISDAILSESKNNTNNDAIGQEWFVISENEYYRLINWENRKSSTGWAIQPRPDSLKTKLDEEVDRAKASEDKIEASVGLDTDGSHKKTSGNYTGQANTITEEISALDTEAKKINDSLASHKADNSNPHNVTKAQVGLGNVDDTADLDKPISKATQTALDGKVDKVPGSDLMSDALKTEITEHLTSKANPHNVTKEQLGLGKVENTSDLEKPVSKATQTALDGKVDKVPGSDLMSEAEKEKLNNIPDLTPIIEHAESKANPHNVTKEQLGLGKVENTSDLEKPISTATQEALEGKVDKVPDSGLISNTLKTEISEHLTSKANPHNVTKEQVGLGNVDNTSDANKPISTATQEALEGKVDKVPGSGLISDTLKTEITGHAGNKSNPHSVTKEQVGLGNVDNTADVDKPISNLTKAALDNKVDNIVTVNGHTLSGNVTVTKGDVGLGSVENLAPTDYPVSKATQAALDGKVDKVEGSLLITEIDLTNLKAHTTNKENPHSVTKEQVGLGNVDNTSDADKPISTATQGELERIKRVTAEGMMTLCDKIRDNDEIMAEILNLINSRLVYLESKVK